MGSRNHRGRLDFIVIYPILEDGVLSSLKELSGNDDDSWRIRSTNRLGIIKNRENIVLNSCFQNIRPKHLVPNGFKSPPTHPSKNCYVLISRSLVKEWITVFVPELLESGPRFY